MKGLGCGVSVDMPALIKSYVRFCVKREMPLWMQIRWLEARSEDDPWYGLYREVLKELRKIEGRR